MIKQRILLSIILSLLFLLSIAADSLILPELSEGSHYYSLDLKQFMGWSKRRVQKGFKAVGNGLAAGAKGVRNGLRFADKGRRRIVNKVNKHIVDPTLKIIPSKKVQKFLRRPAHQLVDIQSGMLHGKALKPFAKILGDPRVRKALKAGKTIGKVKKAGQKIDKKIDRAINRAKKKLNDAADRLEKRGDSIFERSKKLPKKLREKGLISSRDYLDFTRAGAAAKIFSKQLSKNMRKEGEKQIERLRKKTRSEAMLKEVLKLAVGGKKSKKTGDQKPGKFSEISKKATGAVKEAFKEAVLDVIEGGGKAVLKKTGELVIRKGMAKGFSKLSDEDKKIASRLLGAHDLAKHGLDAPDVMAKIKGVKTDKILEQRGARSRDIPRNPKNPGKQIYKAFKKGGKEKAKDIIKNKKQDYLERGLLKQLPEELRNAYDNISRIDKLNKQYNKEKDPKKKQKIAKKMLDAAKKLTKVKADYDKKKAAQKKAREAKKTKQKTEDDKRKAEQDAQRKKDEEAKQKIRDELKRKQDKKLAELERLKQKCGKNMSLDANGNCVFDPRKDLKKVKKGSCPNNLDLECPEGYFCVSYNCMPKEEYGKLAQRVKTRREKEKERLELKEKSGGAGGGSAVSQDEYGKAPYSETDEEDPLYGGYTRHGRGLHGKGYDDYVVDMAEDYMRGRKPGREGEHGREGGHGKGGEYGKGGEHGKGKETENKWYLWHKCGSNIGWWCVLRMSSKKADYFTGDKKSIGGPYETKEEAQNAACGMMDESTLYEMGKGGAGVSSGILGTMSGGKFDVKNFVQYDGASKKYKCRKP